MSKLRAVFVLLQKGSVVADPATWKRGQITVTLVTPVVWALLKLAGLDEQIGSETVDAIALGVVGVANVVLTVVSTDKLGLPTRRCADDSDPA